MKFLSAVLALVAIAAPLYNAATNCATGPTMLTDITYFEMGPMAFCPSKICISFIGTMNGMVVAGAKGKFSISAKVGGKEVYTSVQDTCKVARCPTTAGYMILPLPDTADFPAHVRGKRFIPSYMFSSYDMFWNSLTCISTNSSHFLMILV